MSDKDKVAGLCNIIDSISKEKGDQIDLLKQKNARLQSELDIALEKVGNLTATEMSYNEQLKAENARLQAELQKKHDAMETAIHLQSVAVQNQFKLQAQLDAANLALEGAREAIAEFAPFIKFLATCDMDIIKRLPEEVLKEFNKIKDGHLKIAKALSTLPTPAKALDLTRIAACVKALEYYANRDNWLEVQVLKAGCNDASDPNNWKQSCAALNHDKGGKAIVAITALTPEDHAWVERQGGGVSALPH